MSSEFNLIERYFCHRQRMRADVALAAGDDCALVEVQPEQHIAISTDTLVAGTHFLADADPAWVAHKALASNLSDLAAMGATPAWVSLAFTMPSPDEQWLAPFCQAFFALADEFELQLIGGDTTKGPLSITLTIQGLVPKGQALRRDGAKVGDDIYVTGYLGDSKAGLDCILDAHYQPQAHTDSLIKRHYLSTPRILAGEALRNLASAAIDISDGVIADLTHILTRSNVAATIDVDALPVSSCLESYCDDRDSALQYALTSGEEYELCFTAATSHRADIASVLQQANTPVCRIGTIHAIESLQVKTSLKMEQLHLIRDDQPVNWTLTGFDHFKES